jgi:hypothetical protein
MAKMIKAETYYTVKRERDLYKLRLQETESALEDIRSRVDDILGRDTGGLGIHPEN